MKKVALSFAALALTASGALAADLPSRKGPPVLPPPPPPPPMWTGFYTGLNAGYGFGTNNNVQSVSSDPSGATSLGGFNFTQVNAQNPLFTPANTNIAPYLVGFPTGAGLAQSGNFANTQSGFIGGGQIGYNYQWGQSFLIGIEADIQGSGIRGSSRGVGLGGGGNTSPLAICAGSVAYIANCNASTLGGLLPTNLGNISVLNGATATGATTVNAGVDWMGTVRGRLGYLWTPTLLTYATGGLTYGGVYANVTHWANNNLTVQLANATTGANILGPIGVNQNLDGGGSRSQTLVGWNVGGGLEWMFMPNWSLKTEAIYWNMGNMNVPTATFGAAPVTGVALGGALAPLNTISAFNSASTIGAVRVNYQGVIARAGVNYHFNWGGAAPGLTRY